MIRVLLRFYHGLGDGVQFSVVLKHLAKYRPEWQIDVWCGRGKHTALIGLCNKVWHDQESQPPGPYDTEAGLGWYENYCRFEDKPNSKITNCLQEVFGLPYDPALGRYQVNVRPEARERAKAYLQSIGAAEKVDGKFGTVILHYEGNTSTWKKNLKHWQARALCDLIQKAGRVPVILDWDNRSNIPDQKTIFCPRVGKDDIWGDFGSGDAEMITALVSLSEAFVGIDSGPGKCASATETPSLIIWRQHHPVQFHDPAPNTMHLIPHNWRTVPPAEHDGVARYFEKHYQFTTYHGDEHGLTQTACDWLARLLGVAGSQEQAMTFVCPNGIGDVLWALHKMRSIAGEQQIDILLSGDLGRFEDYRAVPFVQRFGFVRSVEVSDVPVLRSECDEEMNDAKGRYRYMSDGPRGRFHYLIPNATLERGERLETWQPNYPIDWKVVDAFDWKDTERGRDLGVALGQFVCFYLGPELGNVDEGHNRGFLWEPKHWIHLGKSLTERGFRIALVGASYDRSYWERYVRAGVSENGMKWYDFLGELEIGETMALIREAKFFVSYQCGLGIFAHYLGQRVAMWWRPDGDSCHPRRLVAFDERMAHSWTNPEYQDRYIPLIYRRQTVGDLLAEMMQRGWLE